MANSKSTGDLKVGDTFASFQELQHAVRNYGNVRRVQYWRRDTKRLHRAPPRIFEVVKQYPQLEYFSIKFSCVQGGQAFRPKNVFATRQRKSKGTWKQDCKAEILVGLNEDKNRLIVKRIVDEHNHEIPSEEVFQQLSKTRRNVEKAKTAEPKVYEQIMKLEDKQNILSNLVRVNSLARSNNLKRVANVLREKYKCRVTLQADEDDKVIGFFFQDYHMRKCFDMFPEVLLIDGSYVSQNIACCIYVLSVENSLGSCDIVGVGILTTKQKESAEWVMQTFKNSNRKFDKTVIVVSDRHTSDYEIVSVYFPNAAKLICPAHALQTFKKDTQPSKILNVIPSESESAVTFFQQLIEAKTEEEYHTILEDMEDNIPYSLTKYFMKTWQHSRTEWSKAFNSTLRSCVNTKLDSPNSKLKSTIANSKTFDRFVDNFFLLLYLRRTELKFELGRSITKNQPHEDITEHSKHLTPYAVHKIKQSLLQIDDVTFEAAADDSDVVCDGAFVVSEMSCSCEFFTLMKLPCKHLLAYRKLKGVDYVDEYLWSRRWTKNYVNDLFEDVGETDFGEDGDVHERKYRKVHYACLPLAALCCEVAEDVLETRVEVLRRLGEFWQKGEEVKIERVEEGSGVLGDHDYFGQGKMEVDECR